MAWLSSAEAKIEAFVRNNPKFKEVTSNVFHVLETNGRLSLDRAAKAVDLLFDQLSTHLDNLNIPVEKPSPQDVLQLFTASDADASNGLDEQEFEKFYSKVVIYAARRAAGGFVNSYGIGILTGVVAVMAVKRTLRAVPVVGLLVSPVLGLLPSILVGPALGVAATYAIRKEGLENLKTRLFGPDPKAPAQFKKG